MSDFIKRKPEDFERGHGLKELKSFKVRGKSVNEIMTSMGFSGLSARNTSKAVDILEKAIKDKDCKIVLTLSGIVTVSKMGGIICEMIDDGWIDCIIATGALVAHGAIEGRGGVHFVHDSSKSDEALYTKGYDRIYDTLELESNLDNLEEELNVVWDILNSDYNTFASSDFCHETGKLLNEKYPHSDSILKSAYLKKVPIIIPAFTDSELALDGMTYFIKKKCDENLSLDEALEKVTDIKFNPFKDLSKYLSFAKKVKTMAIFTLGGGVPRNYGQQIAPLIDILMNRIDKVKEDELQLKKFKYGVRICPDPVTLGSLSGCTYSEGISWGKFASSKEGGEFSEIHSDYTVILPWIVKCLQERLDEK